MSKDIKNIRDKIDSIDSEILKLLNERAQEAINISKEKQKSKKSDNFYNPERESQVMRRLQELNKGPLSDANISKLFREIMSLCLSMESPLKVSYLGPEGTYTHIATKKTFWRLCAFLCIFFCRGCLCFSRKKRLSLRCCACRKFYTRNSIINT